MDSIRLRRIVGYGYHGVLPEEKRLGQRFVANITLYLDTKDAAASDQVESTVNYAAVYQDVLEILTGPSKNLIETVAENIAAVLLDRYPRVQGTTVDLEKPSAPIPGAFESVSVRIERWRDGQPRT